MSYLEDTFKHEQLKRLEPYLPAAAIIVTNRYATDDENWKISETIRVAKKLQEATIKAINAPS